MKASRSLWATGAGAATSLTPTTAATRMAAKPLNTGTLLAGVATVSDGSGKAKVAENDPHVSRETRRLAGLHRLHLNVDPALELLALPPSGTRIRRIKGQGRARV